MQVVLYAAGGDKTAQEIERYADAFSVAPVHEPRDGKTVGRVARREGEIIALVGALAAHAELEWCDGDLGKDQGAQEGKSGLGQVWAPGHFSRAPQRQQGWQANAALAVYIG